MGTIMHAISSSELQSALDLAAEVNERAGHHDQLGDPRQRPTNEHAALVGFGFGGAIMTFLSTFCITVEVLTSPKATPAIQWSTSVAALLVMTRLLAGFFMPRPAKSLWLLFFPGAVQLSIMAATHMQDPMARVIFTVMPVLGGVWLMLGRWLRERIARQPTLSRRAVTYWALVSWSPILVLLL